MESVYVHWIPFANLLGIRMYMLLFSVDWITTFAIHLHLLVSSIILKNA